MAEKKGAGGKPQEFDKESGQYTGQGTTYRQNTDYSKILADDKKQEHAKKKVELTSQEWAMFYERMGDIKRGDHVDKLPNGDIIIPIETKERMVLVIASGKYGKEKFKLAISYRDRDYMYDLLGELKNGN